jgi:acyl-CoA thioesterase
LTTDYCAAIPNGPVRIETQCDRAGRSTHFWTARLCAEGQEGVALKGTAILAKRREGTTQWQEGIMPDAPPPEDCERRDIPRNWAEHIEIRAAGTQRFAATGRTHSLAWTRFDQERALDMPGLVAFADTPLTRLFLVLRQFTPISTVTKTVYLHATAEDYAEAGEDYLLVEAEGARGGRGFYDQFAKLWTRDGRLLATSQQMVWYKAEDHISTAA